MFSIPVFSKWFHCIELFPPHYIDLCKVVFRSIRTRSIFFFYWMRLYKDRDATEVMYGFLFIFFAFFLLDSPLLDRDAIEVMYGFHM